jgi:serine/threonine protein kinase
MHPVPSADAGGEVLPVQLGKYALLGAIGRGGMADVYLAMARGPSGVRKLVVVKCMRAGSELDSTLAQMFLDEGRLAALLNHANVVHTYEVGQGDEGAYIVMEYLHGQALSAVARAAKPLAPRISARIAADALLGLHYVHELRDLDGTPLSIVHRDLSPPNIFVTHDGVVKLVDFGIAKTALATRASTEAGIVKGKLAYMAPEQTTSGVVDRRADIYAMGVVLWELLAARRLVEGLSPSSVLRHTLHGTAPLVSSVRAEVDPALDRIVERALMRDPEARYATALEMREALEAYLAQGPPIGGKELSCLMAEHFLAQREQRELQIQSWVAAFAPGQPDTLSLALPRESPGVHLSGEQVSGAFIAAPRARRKPWRSQRRLVTGTVSLGVLLFGITLFALHEGQQRSADRANATNLTLNEAVAARVTDPEPSHPELVPRPSLTAAPGAEASEARAIRSSLPPRAVSARRPPPTVVRAPEAANSGSRSLPAAGVASTPAAQPKAKRTPELERNPYMHSE